MKIALFQSRIGNDGQRNLERCLNAVEQAAKAGAELILFPELTLLPFFPQYENTDAADKLVTVDSSPVLVFRESCRENHIWAAPNFYLREGRQTYDASLLIDPNGEIIGTQKMVHIAQAEQFYEQDYYTPSDDGFKVFDTEFGRIGIVVCFDRHYPESIRTEALMGADLILIPTANTKAEPLETFEWEVRIQAFQNGVPIAMCNRTGLEDGMDFAGESLVTDANGGIIVKADDRPGLVYAEVDMTQAKEARQRRPYTTLRRPELYC